MSTTKQKTYYLRICRMCGEIFDSEIKNMLYCCDECRNKAKKISEESDVLKRWDPTDPNEENPWKNEIEVNDD